MKSKGMITSITKDIQKNARSFLPGTRRAGPDLQDAFSAPVLADNLTAEECLLLVSTLPREASMLYVSPLDKGLSGSKVFAMRYRTKDGTKSRQFVCKIGLKRKIDREAQILERIVSPIVSGVAPPVYRQVQSRALVIQDLAGLARDGSLISLREFARRDARGPEMIDRLFKHRLEPFYMKRDKARKRSFRLGTVFAQYLSKGPSHPSATILTGELSDWIVSLAGKPKKTLHDQLIRLKSADFKCYPTIIHGDLHSQNVLISDDSEVWPIDFAWCRRNGCPLVDLIMLECSLKFLAMPHYADIHSLLQVEHQLATAFLPSVSISDCPYKREITNVFSSICSIRSIAQDTFNITESLYRRALLLMSYSLSTHPDLHNTYVRGSLLMQSAALP